VLSSLQAGLAPLDVFAVNVLTMATVRALHDIQTSLEPGIVADIEVWSVATYEINQVNVTGVFEPVRWAMRRKANEVTGGDGVFFRIHVERCIA
jgi:hypothetical protein